MRSDIWLTIAGMALVTYLTRAPLLLALARRPLRPRVRLWLRLVPLAVLPALAVPLVLAPGGRLAPSLTHPPLWGAVVVLVLAGLRVNLLVSVAVAVAAVAVLRALGA
jgi:branched-subunit amino acid transport protein